MTALRIAAIPAIVLAASACGGAPASSPPPPTQRSAVYRGVGSGRLVENGAVSCAASINTPVRAGHELQVTFRIKNISHRTVKVPLSFGSLWLVVKSPDGTTYDTRVPYAHMLVPYVPPTPIPPGRTVTRSVPYIRVRWSGPLRITPGCESTTLPALRVDVTSPGPPASDGIAVSDVVAAAGHLLDHCRPTTAGVALVGRIDAPSGDAPPLQARCSVSLRHARGFDVAQLLVVTPPGLRGVRVQEPYEGLTGPNVRNRNTEAIAWQFVVTRAGARSVYSAETETTKAGSGHMAPEWQWTTAGHGARPGGSRCGGSGSGFGGIDGPLVEFVSICG